MPSPSLYIAFDVFPRAKGSSSHIASMVQALARNFGSVRLLCLGSPEMPGFQREGGIEIYRFRERHRHLLRRATAFAGFVRAHVRRLAGRVPLAVFRDPWGGYPLLRSAARCASLFEVNALPSWELPYSRPDLANNVALSEKLRDIERRCLRESTAILCVSSVTRRALLAEGLPETKIGVIPNVAHDVFFAAEKQRCAVPQLQEGRWFGYIGALQPWQGVDTLIDAFALVATDLPDCRLLVLTGDSAGAVRNLERRIARQRLAGLVLVHSPLPQHEVAGVMARLRFTAVPLADTSRNTQQGCCPVKMAESLAAGIPLIASDLAVCREWIAHGREGLLAPPEDARAWALAIDRLLLDDELRDRLASAARTCARQYFSWQRVHGSLDALFQRMSASFPAEVST